MYDYIACMFAYAPYVCLALVEAEEGAWVAWNWRVVMSCRVGAGNLPSSSERAASALTHQVISPT